jgi:hypothetical protein
LLLLLQRKVALLLAEAGVLLESGRVFVMVSLQLSFPVTLMVVE